MRGLHTVKTPLLQPIIWFGSEFPCSDDFHNGYPTERTSPRDHEVCIINILPHPDRITNGRLCACEICSIDPAHFFAETNIQLQAREGTIAATPLCENCKQEQHPVPDIEHSDTRGNPIIGTADDDMNIHEHEPDRDGHCQFCGDFIEEDQ